MFICLYTFQIFVCMHVLWLSTIFYAFVHKKNKNKKEKNKKKKIEEKAAGCVFFPSKVHNCMSNTDRLVPEEAVTMGQGLAFPQYFGCIYLNK